MSSNFEIKLLTGYNNLFTDPPHPKADYLSGISKAMLIKCSAFLLGFYNNNSKYNNNKTFLEMFFCAENQDYVHDLWNRLKDFGKKNDAEPILISFDSSLKFFELCYNEVNDEQEQTKSKAQTEIDIFTVYLLINDTVLIENNKALVSTQHLSDDEKTFAGILSMSYPYSDFINYDLNNVLVTQIIRAVMAFEFLEKTPETAVLLKKFTEYFECDNWKHYLKKLLPIPFAVLKKTKEAHVEFSIPANEFQQGITAFIDKLAINDTDILLDFDYITVRNKPLYKVDSRNYYIVYGLFAIEKIYKSLYFKLSELNSQLPAAEKIKDLNSLFRDKFSEQYVLYDTLNRIFRNKYVKKSGEELKQLGMIAEPDYYIRNGNKVFLFESKDVMIKASVKVSYDFGQYEPEFKKKFYYDDSNGRIKKKAILQLIGNIENVLNKEVKGDTNYKANLIRIYPILVVHDRQFNLVGLNLMLKKWFNEELGKLTQKGFDISNVKPIVIIDIDSLIQYQDLIRDNYFTLNEVLDAYNESTDLRLQKDKHGRLSRKTIYPFSFFIDDFVNSKHWKKVPALLAEKGFSIFQDQEQI